MEDHLPDMVRANFGNVLSTYMNTFEQTKVSRVELHSLLKDKLDAEYFWKQNEIRLDTSIIANDGGSGVGINFKIQKLQSDINTLFEGMDMIKTQITTTCATQSQFKELSS